MAFVREEEAGSARERAPVIYKHFTFGPRGCASGPCFGFHVVRLRSFAYGQTGPDAHRPGRLPRRRKKAAAARRVAARRQRRVGRDEPGKAPLPASGEAWGGTDGGVRGGQEEADRGGSALRTLIDLGTETSAILLALRGAVAEPVGEPGSGEEGESGDFEDENHCRVRRVA